jgi:hypothetical protein
MSRRVSVLGVCGLTLAAIMFTAPGASASGQVVSPDGGATLNYYSSVNSFVLRDSRCDGHSVYAQYRLNGGATQRVDHSAGCNTERDWSVPGTGTIQYRACTNIQLGADSCSSWRTDSL